MQTPDQTSLVQGGSGCLRLRLRSAWSRSQVLVWTLALFLIGGCSKQADMSAIETDAHGYLCQKCGAKFYTGRKVFMESQCPKCQQYTLVDVVGYMCLQDHHLTILPRITGPQGTAICEVCQAHLTNAMASPHQKDLIAWGATKAPPGAAR
jgi:hypothetical protein